MIDLVMAAASAYIGACVVGASSLFDPVRAAIMSRTPFLKIGHHKHFVECRLCLTFWTSCVAVAMFQLAWEAILPVYGLAYFAATQER